MRTVFTAFRKNRERTTPHADAIRGELIDLLYTYLPAVLAANAVNGLLIALIFYNVFSTYKVFIWTAIMFIMVAVRLLIWMKYSHPGSDPDHIRFWSRVAVVGSASSGAIWGSAGWLFFRPDLPISYAVLTFVLGGMASGALVGLGSHLSAFCAYLIPSIIPFGLRLAVEGTTEHLAMSGMLFIYMIGMLLLGRRYHFSLVQSLSLRFQNADLLRTLEGRVEERTGELQVANAKLRRLAMQDPLTELPNRTAFKQNLQHAHARLRRSGGSFALLVVDLDYFKDVNDLFGHPIGDQLLQETASRLRACVRATDPPARLGGDEFSIIVTDLDNPAAAAIVASKVIERLSEPRAVQFSLRHRV